MAEVEMRLYDRVVHVTAVYLGPAAERFIARQVQNHLHKAPETITTADLLVLIDWIRVAVAVLTEDTEIVDEYTAELRRLTISKPTNKATA
ncbi:MAG: hypothetical protein ABIV43_00455 [Candidatus Saccharimonadales bacterium]